MTLTTNKPPLAGEMPTWALIPFVPAPVYIGYWYLFGPELRFSSPAFGAAKQLGGLVLPGHPMAAWGLVLWVIALWLVAGIWLHRADAHDATGWLPIWRTRVLAIALVAAGAFTIWWGFIGTLQAVRNPAAAPTGAGWLSVVAYSYILAAIRVASGRDR